MRLYISGPMSGYPGFNIEAFDKAAAAIRLLGHDVISPAEEDGEATRDVLLASKTGDSSDIPSTESWAHYLTRDLGILLDGHFTGLVLLPGWEGSRGSRIEMSLARDLGLDIFEWTGVLVPYQLQPAGDPRFHALLKEIGATHDKKQRDYGTTADPFANVRGSKDWGIEPWIGAMVRANDKVKRLQKYARDGQLANESARDSFIDLAVYALIALVLHDESAS